MQLIQSRSCTIAAIAQNSESERAMCEVVTLGECMAVLYPREPVTLDDAAVLALDIGGAEANLSIGLSRLGHRARFISRVGDDPFGQRMRATLEREGVDTSYLTTDTGAQTGVFFREWLPDGARRVYYYRAGSAASRLAPEDLQPAAFEGAKIVHLTGITPALSASCAATVARAIELAHAAGALVSFDPNYRPRLWDIPTARAALRARVVVLKRAERGALALADGKRYFSPAHPVTQVIDPVGAGDGFDAGFLAGWLRGASIDESLNLGARIGAAAVEVLGDYAGYPREPRTENQEPRS